MPDVIDSHRNVESMDLPSLLARYEELASGLTKLSNGLPDPNARQDDVALQEMCVILANLRKRSAGPPKVRKTPTGTRTRVSTPVVAPSLDQL